MPLSLREMKSVIKKVFGLQVDKKLHVPVCFWGATGVGKTAAISQAAKELSREIGRPVQWVVLKPGQADSAGDLLGMPEVVEYHECPQCPGGGAVDLERDALVAHLVAAHATEAAAATAVVQGLFGRRRQRFAITDIWPRRGPVIVCIDEINRAAPDIRNALFGLINERVFELTGYCLPDDAIVVATANPPGDAYGDVHEMDGAMVKRMVHFNVQTEPDEWLDYMADQPESADGAGRHALAFFRANLPMLSQKPAPNEVIEQMAPSYRTNQALVRLSTVLTGKLLAEAATGTLGAKAGKAFVEFMQKQEDWVRAKDILTDFSKVQLEVAKMVKEGRKDKFLQTQADLVQFLGKHDKPLTAKQVRNLASFLRELGADDVWSLIHLLAKLDAEAEAGSPIKMHYDAISTDPQITKLTEEHAQRVQQVLKTQ